MKSRPFVVQFGAGAIGRGFLGQLWTEGGHPVLFVDVNAPLVEAINAKCSYPLRITGDTQPQHLIAPVEACLVSDTDAVVSALVVCEFACTAVGVSVFSALAPLLAKGVAARAKQYRQEDWAAHPLNFLCCENQKNAGLIFRDATAKHLPLGDALVRAYWENHVGFVDASVGRMVPPPLSRSREITPELLQEDPLLLVAEPYALLPIDGAAWKGTVPLIAGLLPKNNFAAYVARKLFTHNGGHALLAYEGFLRGHEFIWQCLQDPVLADHLRDFWNETGTALCAAFGFDPAEQKAHETDLFQRFANRELGDTVLRVGRDPVRKLRPDDRLVGAARLCEAHGIVPVHAARAIAAAFRFDPPASANDPSAERVQNTIRGVGGVQQAMTTFAGIVPDESLARQIMAFLGTTAAQQPPMTADKGKFL